MMETRLHAQPITAPPTSFTPVRGGLLQRKCACGGSAGIAGDCEGCSRQNLSLRRSTQNPEPETRNYGGVPPIVNEVLSSPGQPLDPETRAFMEPRFGHDFSNVRVHTDSYAAESARGVNALAYTVEHNVVFGAGQYKPTTTGGRRLLAHELAHVIQQDDRQGGLQRLVVGATNDIAEREAEAVAICVSGGAAASLQDTAQSSDHLQRTPGDPTSSPGETATGSAAQGVDTSGQGQTEFGGLCFRTPLPPGQIRFEGCSNEQLARYLILPEHGDKLISPAANTWHDGDGVWSMDHTPADEWFKVPSHCDMTLRCSGQSFSGTSCCNAAASLFKGKPRWVNDGHDAKKNLPKSPP